MSGTVSRLPPMQRVVEVEFLGEDFNPPTFFRHHARRIILGDVSLNQVIEHDEVVRAPMRGKVKCIYPTMPTRLIEVASSNARLWHLACILERNLRGVSDQEFNPLCVRGVTVAYFPLHVRHRTSPTLLRPERTSVAWVIEIRKEVGHVRLFKRRLAEVTAEPGTLILEAV